MNRVLSIIVLGALLAVVALDSRTRVTADRHAERLRFAVARDCSSPAPRHLYEHDLNFYEFVLTS